MKKTALQQAIDKLEAKKSPKMTISYNEAIDEAVEVLKSLLPIEKEQIINAHGEGWHTGFHMICTSNESYFNNTYENPEAEKGNKE